MKHYTALMSAAIAAASLALAGAASAAPVTGSVISHPASASQGSAVEKVGWHRRRHCHNGHCRWRRVWIDLPGVGISIGGGRRHHHHHHHHHRRHRH